MPEFTICYRLQVDGTITVEAIDVEAARDQVEATPGPELLANGENESIDVSVEDGW